MIKGHLFLGKPGMYVNNIILENSLSMQNLKAPSRKLL